MAHLDDMVQSLEQGDSAKALRFARQFYTEDQSSDKDKAVAIARAAAKLYREFLNEPVVEFSNHTVEIIPEPAGSIIRKGLERLFVQSNTWEEKLDALRDERLCRDLREYIRSGKQREALDTVQELLQIAKENNASLRKRSSFIGSVIGSVLSREPDGKKLAAQIASRAEKLGITPEDAAALESARQTQRDELMAANLENLENQWLTQLKGAQVEILNTMPPKNQLDEPDNDTIRAVSDLFRAILRTPLKAGKSHYFVEATQLLVDFCPRETSDTAKQSGVEARSYDSIGYKAKKAVGLAFLELGESTRLTNAFLKWAREQKQSPHFALVIELMGAFRNNCFSDSLLEIYRDRNYKPFHNDVLASLSNLTTQPVAELLLDELNQLLRNTRTIDPSVVRQATVFIESLGRMIRSPRTTEATQKVILQRLPQIIPQNENRLSLPAIRMVLIPKVDLLPTETRDWLVHSLVDNLFVPQQITAMEKSPEKKGDPAGHRSGIVKLLERLVDTAEDPLCRAFDARSNKYSAAFIAGSQVLMKIKCKQSLFVLEHMISSTMELDEGRLMDHQKELYYDSASDKWKPVTKDMVLGALVYAVGDLGGPHSKPILKRVMQAYRRRELVLKGNETLEMLSRYLGTEFSYEEEEEVQEDAVPDSLHEAPGLNVHSPSAPKLRSAPLPQAELEALVKKLTAYYLFSKTKKISEKVSALAQLAQHTPASALEVVMNQFLESDPLIHSAAVTAVASYANLNRGEALGKEALMRCLEGLENSKERYRLGCKEALKAMTGREVREQIQRYGSSTSSGSVRLLVQEVLGAFVDSPGRQTTQSEDLEDEDQDERHSSSSTPKRSQSGSSNTPPKKSAQNLLEAKREYFAARQAWLAGGKKGPEPKPPKGM
ncbi:MAG: hypothetical protein SFY68_11990 [Candidatus Sumerlaeia bacterium]|nr:hypothetical protein [Candidatus Sumerlaeia bacterium]